MWGSIKNRLQAQIYPNEKTLAGRESVILETKTHYLTERSLLPPYPAGYEKVLFGMGCFWGAERIFWNIPGVFVTAVGYAGGITKNPTYEEVCTGHTNHAEVVLVVFDPKLCPFDFLLKRFWESHDPTQGMRQGNDSGTQYRSLVGTYTQELNIQAIRSKTIYTEALKNKGFSKITTEIMNSPEFYFAEEYHQQYLVKHPKGYCGLQGTGVNCYLS